MICKYYKNKTLFISPCGDTRFCPAFLKPVWVVLKIFFLNKGLMSEGSAVKTFFCKSYL